MNQGQRWERGALWMAVTAGLFATCDMAVKQLGGVLPVLVLVAFRYGFQAMALATWVLVKSGMRAFRTSAPGLQFLRAALLLGNATTAFLGAQAMPLPEFSALMMLAPIMSTLLSSALLGAQVMRAAWGWIGLALAGALLVIRPGTGSLGMASLLPLASAACMSGVHLINRRFGPSENLAVTNFFSAVGVLLMLPVAALWLSWPHADALATLHGKEWLLLLTIGTAATVGHITLSAAFRAAPISSIAPLAYLQIVFAVFFGWAVFKMVPDWISLAGILMIAAGGAGNLLAHAPAHKPAGPG